MMKSKKVLLTCFLKLLITVSCGAKEDFKTWYEKMNDLKFECQTIGEAGDAKSPEEIFKVVDCNDKNAVYRYNYQVR